MAITESVTREHFVHRFMTMRPNQFSYGGLSALYDYLDDLSDDMQKDIELDVIAICCEYAAVSYTHLTLPTTPYV